MIPTLRAVIVCLAGLPVALLATLVAPGLWTVWAAWVLLTFVAILADAIFALPARGIEVTVDAPSAMAIGEEAACRITLTLRTPWRQRVHFLCELSGLFEPPESSVVTLPGRRSVAIDVPLRALRRGQGSVQGVWLRWHGPLGLVERRRRQAVERLVKVMPDLRPVRAAAATVHRRTEQGFGAKQMRFVGEGSEFDSLRDYVPGLDHRSINWKASARHRRLLCQENRAERDQHVVIAVDTGHLMSESLDGIPRLDHAVSAALLLAWGCLRTGDRVGLYAFDARPSLWIEPQAGMRSFGLLRARASELEYGVAETNYTLGLSLLGTRIRRRSLIVLITDFVDDVAARLMIETLAPLTARHLVLFVSLRDPLLGQVAHAWPESTTDVHRAAVAGDLLREREVVLGRLRRLGAQCLDCMPGTLSSDLLARYLDIKRRELL